MSSARPARVASRQSGFAYLFLLFALAVMGLLMASMGQNWTTTAQREREADLLFIGKQFSLALARYGTIKTEGTNTPGAPATLDDLLEDKRFPFPVRHLRQIPRDPMTGKRDWELEVSGGRIIGVRSQSRKMPFRQTPPDYVVMPSDAGESVSYHDWLFIATQSDAAAPTVASAPLATP